MSALILSSGNRKNNSLSLLNEIADTVRQDEACGRMVNSRAQQKAQTRQIILDAAREHFSSAGYQETTTRQIARTCQVSIGTVFAHFPSKQALLDAVLAEVIAQALADARSRLSAADDAFEALLVYARELYGAYLRNRSLSRELLRYGLFSNEGPSDQLAGFTDELQQRLAHRQMSDTKRQILANALFSHYFAVLVGMLRDENSTVDAAVAQLQAYLALYEASAVE